MREVVHRGGQVSRLTGKLRAAVQFDLQAGPVCTASDAGVLCDGQPTATALRGWAIECGSIGKPGPSAATVFGVFGISRQIFSSIECFTSPPLT